MRIDRVQVDGFGPLSGSTFTLPREGVGLWTAPSGRGKSRLPEAVVAALYGPGTGEHAGTITLDLTLDDGTMVSLRRDLHAGTLRITDADGLDLTERYATGGEPGLRLTGASREVFALLLRIGPGELATTPGNDALRQLLDHGRSAALPAGPPPPAIAPPGPRPTAPDSGATWQVGDGMPSSERLLALDDESPARSAPRTAQSEAEAAIRAQRTELVAARQELETHNQEYVGLSARLEELESERSRLGSLEGAEPADLERLEHLVRLLRNVDERRQQLARDRTASREELAARGIDPSRFPDLERHVGTLGDSERAFLESFRQMEMILRGNQALTRSESRLDESRIQEIERARRGAARTATAPLLLAMLGLFGSVAIPFLPPIPVPAGAFQAVGLAGAALGVLLLLRARRFRSAELGESREKLTRKREQLAQFEHEAEEAGARLAQLATERSLEDGRALMAAYEEWQSCRAEIHEFERFERQEAGVLREAVALREKIGSFVVGDDSDGTDLSADELDAILADYTRHFEVQREIDETSERIKGFESVLADTGERVSALRGEIGDRLASVGLDPNGDLDESIERYVRRVAAPAPGETTPNGEPGPGTLTAPRTTGPPEWSAALSRRTEDILRRFLPGARGLEIGADLVVRFRRSERGPVESADPETLGSAAFDQVCLALRLAIVETLSSQGERIPVFLDDPFVRADDARHDRGVSFLVEDASTRNQIVLMTSHEVRTRWYLHQHPRHRDALVPLSGRATGAAAAAQELSSSSSSSSRS